MVVHWTVANGSWCWTRHDLHALVAYPQRPAKVVTIGRLSRSSRRGSTSMGQGLIFLCITDHFEPLSESTFINVHKWMSYFIDIDCIVVLIIREIR